jgi:hypothetical protein
VEEKAMFQRSWMLVAAGSAPAGGTAGGNPSSSWLAPSAPAAPAAAPATAPAGGAAATTAETPPAAAGASTGAVASTGETKKPSFRLPGHAGTPQAGADAGALVVGVPGLTGGIQLPANLPPEAVAAMNQLAGQAMAGMQEVEERPGLPNWQKLAALLPDQLGGFTAESLALGATAMAMGMATTTATRSYRAPDGRTADVTLAGGDIAPIAAMEFGFRIPDENTPEHVRRRVEVRGKPAMIEWTKEGGRAEARTLVADKFSVIVAVGNAADATAAQNLLEALDLAALARIP